MTFNEQQDKIIEEFTIFEDWMDKYNYLIELSKDLPEIDPKYKTQEYLIEGCQSKVWLHAWMKEGKVYYMGDSDAIIVKGIVALMIRALSGQSPQDIIDSDLSFINVIGLKEHLSPTRSNGLVAMIKQMRLFAIAASRFVFFAGPAISILISAGIYTGLQVVPLKRPGLHCDSVPVL